MYGNEVVDYGIKMPGPDIMEDFFNKTPVDLSHLAQWGSSVKPLGPEPEEPKKIIHRRIILD